MHDRAKKIDQGIIEQAVKSAETTRTVQEFQYDKDWNLLDTTRVPSDPDVAALQAAVPYLPKGWGFKPADRVADHNSYFVVDDQNVPKGRVWAAGYGGAYNYAENNTGSDSAAVHTDQSFSTAVFNLAKLCSQRVEHDKNWAASSKPIPVIESLEKGLSLLPEDWSFKPSNRGKFGHFLHEPDGTIRGEVWEAQYHGRDSVYRHNLAGHDSLFEFNDFSDAVMSLVQHCITKDASTEPPPPPELSKEEYNRQTLIAAQAVIDGVLQLMNWIEEEIVSSTKSMNTGRVVVLEEVLIRLQALDRHVFKLCDEPPHLDVTFDLGAPLTSSTAAAFFGGMFAHMIGQSLNTEALKLSQQSLPKPNTTPEQRKQWRTRVNQARQKLKPR